jgi:hypothetical protein
LYTVTHPSAPAASTTAQYRLNPYLFTL